MPAPERRALPVGQCAPHPLGRPETVALQPQRRGDQLHGPDAEDDGELSHAVDRAVETEAVTVRIAESRKGAFRPL